MEVLRIRGGVPLKGRIKAAGAKNGITKMLVASLLSNKRSIFTNVPNILEVETTVALLEEIGAEIEWDRQAQVMHVITKDLKTTYVPKRFSGANRIPILLMGALLGRTREEIIVPMAGGCNIGKRPIDFHISSLKKLGATVDCRKINHETAYVARTLEGLQGTLIELPYPSVGATENTILAACNASGTTVIKNAAVEPEINDLILYLQKLGVRIHVDVNRTIQIQETKEYHEVTHRVLTDRIEAASLGMAAISTKGRVFVEGAEQAHLIIFLNKLREIGAGFDIKDNGIEFFYKGPLKGGIHLETDVHPGFLTDWQQPFVVLLTQADGTSVIHETVYENRFGYTKMLKEMGADIQLFTDCLGGRTCRFASQNYNHSLLVKGPTPLTGKNISVPDLRAGFAYVMAALIAPEESEISGLPYLDRGYEDIDGKLKNLNAKIERVTLKEKKPLLI